MSRTKFVAGNWKMFTSRQSAAELAAGVVKGIGNSSVQVAVCPPFPWLTEVGAALSGSSILLGAQNCHYENEGAFTGETSPVMVRECGCSHVIIGHSERRHGLGETDELLNKKLKAALQAGLSVIFCIGELLSEREADRTEKVLETQLQAGLAGLSHEQMAKVVIAYEPVWAIGTGKVATTEQAQAAHAFIRGKIATIFSRQVADETILQYGGSVKPDNAAALLHQPDVDGALVGGASLKVESFLAIVNAAK